MNQSSEGGLRPADQIEAHEWARYMRGRASEGAKLAALAPAWLKAHARAGRMPEPFRPEFSVKVPSVSELLGPRRDPRIAYYFPGGQLARIADGPGFEPRAREAKEGALMVSTDSTAQYIAAFCKLNHLRQEGAR